jgi:hypothetical protein
LIKPGERYIGIMGYSPFPVILTEKMNAYRIGEDRHLVLALLLTTIASAAKDNQKRNLGLLHVCSLLAETSKFWPEIGMHSNARHILCFSDIVGRAVPK